MLQKYTILRSIYSLFRAKIDEQCVFNASLLTINPVNVCPEKLFKSR